MLYPVELWDLVAVHRRIRKAQRWVGMAVWRKKKGKLLCFPLFIPFEDSRARDSVAAGEAGHFVAFLLFLALLLGVR